MMPSVRACELPAAALLQRYAQSGAFADCYVAEIARSVSLAELVEAFYTSAVFRMERLILRFGASRPSTDLEARQLAGGLASSFAAWSVEDREPDQLLLADFTGRTKSWFMVSRSLTSAAPATRLFFGSAIVPVHNPNTGQSSLGPLFKSLLGFHKLYSRVLLGAARSRLSR